MSRSKHINDTASRSSTYSKWTTPNGDVNKREYKKTIKESSTKALKGGLFDSQTKETICLNSRSV